MKHDYSKTRQSLAKLFVIIVSIGLTASFFAPTQCYFGERSYKKNCALNLRAIGVAFIQHSTEHQAFPHIKSAEMPHDTTDVSKVFRALISDRYIDNTEVYICPESEDF
ncbi:MAG: hypothetical protein P1V97_06960, partial [Planctomycetota bacterium]|nr:hypothetical protein [Planctomycetota bacterium]